MISACRSVNELWNQQHQIEVCFEGFFSQASCYELRHCGVSLAERSGVGAKVFQAWTWPQCHLPSPPTGVPLAVHHPVEGTPAGRRAVPCPRACLHRGIPGETPP